MLGRSVEDSSCVHGAALLQNFLSGKGINNRPEAIMKVFGRKGNVHVCISILIQCRVYSILNIHSPWLIDTSCD